jgi:hypothetical protein
VYNGSNFNTVDAGQAVVVWGRFDVNTPSLDVDPYYVLFLNGGFFHRG